MPRIDPLELLKCLSGLLAPNGGIRSANDVRRLTVLMSKFCKKLVSKCIYIQILKCTETDLLGQFMSVGGWALVHVWLTDGIQTKNWPLVQELLELLLLCPVDVQRLKSNTAPKLVKQLCKDGGIEAVPILATKLVEQWLKIVKSETVAVDVNAGPIVMANQYVESTSDVNFAVADNKDHSSPRSYADSTSDLPIPPMSPSQSTIDSSMVFIDSLAADEVDSLVEEAAADLDPLHLNVDPVENNIGLDEAAAVPVKPKGLVYKITVKDGKVCKVDNASPQKTMAPGGSKLVAKRKISDAEPAVVNIKQRKNSDDEVASVESFSTKSSDVVKDKIPVGELQDRLSSSKDSDRSKEKSKSSRDREKEREKERTKDRQDDKYSRQSSSSSSSKNRSNSSSTSQKSSSSSSRSSRDDKGRHRSSSSKSSSSSSRDKYREKSSSSKSETNVVQSVKDKETLTIVMSQSINKLGKIPKKPRDNDSDKSDTTNANVSSPTTKKPSISIEVRKDFENRPKTVKTFNSKFRSHGLAEEAPPPPSRRGLKKPSSAPSAPGTTIPTSSSTAFKRHSVSPTHDVEKKPKLDVSVTSNHVDKPGSIKLISPKPKPSLLLESDMFMDALSAATTTKKDAAARKRKRRTSPTKDVPSAADTPITPTKSEAPSFANKSDNASTELSAKGTTTDDDMCKSTAAEKSEDTIAHKAEPMKFYQDTLSESKESPEKGDAKDDPKSDSSDEDDDKPLKRLIDDSVAAYAGKTLDESSDVKSPIQEIGQDDDNSSDPPAVKPPGPGCGPNGPPGVLIVHRRKGPKKQLRWRPQEQLEEVRYFELDENERINVTKTFVDMKQMERINEREGFIMARKLNGEDTMTEKIPWVSPLFVVEDVPPHPDGANSKEREVQLRRQESCLQVLYFNLLMIPDNPAEPDFEVPPPMHDPHVIPTEDVTGNPDAVNDFTNLSWPESRGNTQAPQPSSTISIDVNTNFVNQPDPGFQNVPGSGFGFNPKSGPNMQNWNPNGSMPPMMEGPPPGFNMMNGPDMNMGPNIGPMGGNVPMGPNVPMGVAGPMVPNGPMGGIGPMGPNGPMGGGGPMGPNGPMGGVGPMGPNGPMGGVGPMGPMGPMGGPPMNGGMPPFVPNGPNNFGPPPPFNNGNNFNNMAGNNPHWRRNGPPMHGNNWRGGHHHIGGGRPPWMNRSRICKSFSKGFCRNGDKCNFLHPGQNCPMF